MTPLTWSVLAFMLDDWILVPGTPSVGNIGGRPYLNISAIATALRLTGRGRADVPRPTFRPLLMRK
jgi:rifampicin phosphotransferase